MKHLLTFAAVLAATSLGAFGSIVTYDTVGSTLCIGNNSCFVSTQTVNDVIVTFNPVSNGMVDASPSSFASLGEIQVSCVGGGTVCGPTSIDGLVLHLHVDQTTPTNGTADIVPGDITGAISGSGSSALVTWTTPNAVSIGLVTYSIANNNLALVPVSTHNGVTTIQALISARDFNINQVPEPSTYLLLSGGLMGLGLIRRRR